MAPKLADEWLELEKSLGTRPVLKGSPEEIVAQFTGLGEMLASQMPPPDPSVSTHDQTVDGVPIRIYTPDGASGKKLPVGVYTHGGGFICGNLDSEDPICRAVAKHTPCIIVSVDYRLGPKHKMPAMLDDTLTAYKWAWHNAESFGGDQSKFFSIGGSAGGALALAVANKIVSNPAVRGHIQGIVAIVPATLHPDNVPSEYQSMYKAYEENGVDAPIIDKESMITFYEAVGSDPKSPDQFVALVKNLEHFPPTYIAVCGADPLRDDGVVMEHALKKAGVKTKIDNYAEYPHYFWIFPSIKKGQEFIGNMLAGVQFVLSSQEISM
ncbi:hypothetical protein B0A49_02415 [Cryomyces minteri]|uniref:Alpha/beta hydrolase fold-3 domain-containing protein n=1 Tax=Cryomyces minteri TaxID=331657 RepID=A0A4U0XFL1_9PEZI|nr:hypothetical protein B0A49_02415 [Cryomyces minteri]